MAARLPDLSPTPEEFTDPDDLGQRPVLVQSRLAFNLHLQERLLTCGNQGALDEADAARMARRPSLPGGDHDEASYFSMLRKVRIPCLSLVFGCFLLVGLEVVVLTRVESESEEFTEFEEGKSEYCCYEEEICDCCGE
jgi:hypothetical protein